MTKRNPISVPDGYFQDLEQRLGRIPREDVQPRGVRRLAPYVAYAASLAVLVVIGSLILRPGTKTQERVSEELTEEDIRSFLLEGDTSVELLAMLNDEEAY